MDARKQQRTTSYLIVRQRNEPDQVVLWDTVEITVGRGDDQDIVVHDSEVSRQHAVFRQKEGCFTIEDQGTGLGTLVNGESIRLHELQPDDTIEISVLSMKFGQTTQAIKPGKNIRFSSELKGFAMPAAPDGAAGRTMMAFDVEDDLLSSSHPTLIGEKSRARTVSADGNLEDHDGPDCLGTEEFDIGGPDVIDLDATLAADLDCGLGPLDSDSAPILTRSPVATPAVQPSLTAETSVRLVLEITGPAAQVEAIVAAIREKRIEVPPLTLRVQDPRQR